MNDVLCRKWHDLLRAWAVDPTLAGQVFEEVRKHYAEPGRFYHTLDHVHNVLATVDSLGAYARNLNAVKLAAWLHDVIYDSSASDNEERSADYAERLCEKLSIPEGRIVASLILKTKTHDAGADFAYDASKTALNAFTVHLAQELRGTKIKVNSAHPGWVKTDLGGSAAPMEVSEGGKTSVQLATLPDNGPTGGYFHLGEPLPW